MRKLIIIEDVRFLGVGYSPGEEPVEVDDDVASELIKGKFAVEHIEEDPLGGSSTDQNSETGDQSGDPAGDKQSTGQQTLFAAPENAALVSAPENK